MTCGHITCLESHLLKGVEFPSQDAYSVSDHRSWDSGKD